MLAFYPSRTFAIVDRQSPFERFASPFESASSSFFQPSRPSLFDILEQRNKELQQRQQIASSFGFPTSFFEESDEEEDYEFPHFEPSFALSFSRASQREQQYRQQLQQQQQEQQLRQQLRQQLQQRQQQLQLEQQQQSKFEKRISKALKKLHKQSNSSPNFEISTDNEKTQLKVQLPGYSKKDVQVKLEDGHLKISGTRVHTNTNDDVTTQSTSTFSRSFPVDERVVAEDKVEAFWKNGFLTIQFPNPKENQEEKLEQTQQTQPQETEKPKENETTETPKPQQEQVVSEKSEETTTLSIHPTLEYQPQVPELAANSNKKEEVVENQ